MSYKNLIKIETSPWFSWKNKSKLNNIKHSGVYILAKFKSNVDRDVNLLDKDIIYIGETCSSFRKRLNQFNRAAFKDGDKHSGGLSYRKKYNDKGDDLYVSILAIFEPDDIKDFYIKYLERRLILDYIIKNGRQRLLNKK